MIHNSSEIVKKTLSSTSINTVTKTFMTDAVDDASITAKMLPKKITVHI